MKRMDAVLESMICKSALTLSVSNRRGPEMLAERDDFCYRHRRTMTQEETDGRVRVAFQSGGPG
jgi:hypothetical protein